MVVGFMHVNPRSGACVRALHVGYTRGETSGRMRGGGDARFCWGGGR